METTICTLSSVQCAQDDCANVHMTILSDKFEGKHMNVKCRIKMIAAEWREGDKCSHRDFRTLLVPHEAPFKCLCGHTAGRRLAYKLFIR